MCQNLYVSVVRSDRFPFRESCCFLADCIRLLHAISVIKCWVHLNYCASRIEQMANKFGDFFLNGSGRRETMELNSNVVVKPGRHTRAMLTLYMRGVYSHWKQWYMFSKRRTLKMCREPTQLSLNVRNCCWPAAVMLSFEHRSEHLLFLVFTTIIASESEHHQIKSLAGVGFSLLLLVMESRGRQKRRPILRFI